MSVSAAIWTIANFFMPAWVLAGLLAWLAPRIVGGQHRHSWAMSWLLNGLLGSGVLVGGLMLTHNDGRMATYAALVIAQATLQAGLLRHPLR